MKTKAEIIQKLLDEKHIKVEEAMVLMEKEKEYIYQPYYPYYYWSIQPYVNNPVFVTTPLSGINCSTAPVNAFSVTTNNGNYSYAQN